MAHRGNNINSNTDCIFNLLFIYLLIQNMAIVALPKDQYGTFHDSDCYLIYSASQQGQLSGIDVIVSVTLIYRISWLLVCVLAQSVCNYLLCLIKN